MNNSRATTEKIYDWLGQEVEVGNLFTKIGNGLDSPDYVSGRITGMTDSHVNFTDSSGKKRRVMWSNAKPFIIVNSLLPQTESRDKALNKLNQIEHTTVNIDKVKARTPKGYLVAITYNVTTSRLALVVVKSEGNNIDCRYDRRSKLVNAVKTNEDDNVLIIATMNQKGDFTSHSYGFRSANCKAAKALFPALPHGADSFVTIVGTSFEDRPDFVNAVMRGANHQPIVASVINDMDKRYVYR